MTKQKQIKDLTFALILQKQAQEGILTWEEATRSLIRYEEDIRLKRLLNYGKKTKV